MWDAQEFASPMGFEHLIPRSKSADMGSMHTDLQEPPQTNTAPPGPSAPTTGQPAMIEVLNRNLYLVKEHVGMFKASHNYDIFDPETGQMILTCREPKLGILTKLMRFTDYKRMTPFHIVVATPDGSPVVEVKRGISLFLSTVRVLDEQGRPIGGFKQKLFSIGGSFTVLDEQDNPLCMLKGKWTGWDFRFVSGDLELARVTKKWSGLGKEMFTSADNYMLEIAEHVEPNNPLRQLILAAVMCIDLVLKE